MLSWGNKMLLYFCFSFSYLRNSFCLFGRSFSILRFVSSLSCSNCRASFRFLNVHSTSTCGTSKNPLVWVPPMLPTAAFFWNSKSLSILIRRSASFWRALSLIQSSSMGLFFFNSLLTLIALFWTVFFLCSFFEAALLMPRMCCLMFANSLCSNKESPFTTSWSESIFLILSSSIS